MQTTLPKVNSVNTASQVYSEISSAYSRLHIRDRVMIGKTKRKQKTMIKRTPEPTSATYHKNIQPNTKRFMISRTRANEVRQ